MDNWRVLLRHKEYDNCYKTILYIGSDKFQIGKDHKYNSKEEQEKIWVKALDFSTNFEKKLTSMIIYADI